MLALPFMGEVSQVTVTGVHTETLNTIDKYGHVRELMPLTANRDDLCLQSQDLLCASQTLECGPRGHLLWKLYPTSLAGRPSPSNPQRRILWASFLFSCQLVVFYYSANGSCCGMMWQCLVDSLSLMD